MMYDVALSSACGIVGAAAATAEPVQLPRAGAGGQKLDVANVTTQSQQRYSARGMTPPRHPWPKTNVRGVALAKAVRKTRCGREETARWCWPLVRRTSATWRACNQQGLAPMVCPALSC